MNTTGQPCRCVAKPVAGVTSMAGGTGILLVRNRQRSRQVERGVAINCGRSGYDTPCRRLRYCPRRRGGGRTAHGSMSTEAELRPTTRSPHLRPHPSEEAGPIRACRDHKYCHTPGPRAEVRTPHGSRQECTIISRSMRCKQCVQIPNVAAGQHQPLAQAWSAESPGRANRTAAPRCGG